MTSTRIWVVIPVLLDVEQFLVLRERVHEAIADTQAASDARVTFTLLDDSAGRDPAIEHVRELDDVVVIEPPFGLGHQRAIVYALRTVVPRMQDGDTVVTMDSDGEDRPEDLPRLLDALGEAGAGDIVLAKRTRRRTSLSFKLLYAGFRVMFRVLTGTSVRTGNYVAARAGDLRPLLLHPLFDLSYSSTFTALGVPVRHVPCERGIRYGGHSRMGYSGLLIHGIRMLMPFVERIAVRALVLFAVTLTLGIAIAIAVIAVRLVSDAVIPDWATYTLVGALLLSLISLGNFITLFTTYSQGRATSLANIERYEDEGTRGPRSPSD